MFTPSYDACGLQTGIRGINVSSVCIKQGPTDKAPCFCGARCNKMDCPIRYETAQIAFFVECPRLSADRGNLSPITSNQEKSLLQPQLAAIQPA